MGHSYVKMDHHIFDFFFACCNKIKLLKANQRLAILRLCTKTVKNMVTHFDARVAHVSGFYGTSTIVWLSQFGHFLHLSVAAGGITKNTMFYREEALIPAFQRCSTSCPGCHLGRAFVPRCQGTTASNPM